jgi:hypothetical protein
MFCAVLSTSLRAPRSNQESRNEAGLPFAPLHEIAVEYREETGRTALEHGLIVTTSLLQIPSCNLW